MLLSLGSRGGGMNALIILLPIISPKGKNPKAASS
jgi:hypothetical protein